MATLLYKTRALYSDILLRNSLYLLLTTGVLAASGFFFWLLSAHLLPTTDIGVAATLVSMMNLISTFGLVGLDTSIIRYLNHAQNQSDELTTAFIVSSIASFIIGLVFVALAGFIAPELRVVQQNVWYVLLFALFCVGSTVNLLSGAAFVAYRNTQRWFAVNAAFSVLKLFFPLLFVAGGAFGIFAAAAAAQLVGGILSVALLMREFNYRARFVFDTAMLKRVWSYSLGNYTSGIFNFLPQTLLPLIIAATLGVADNAYFYIVMMIGNLLYTVPASMSRALLAEGAFEAEGLQSRSRISLGAMFALTTVGVICIMLFGRYVLALFGDSYAADGLMLLYFVALAALPQSAYSYWGTLLRLKRETAPLIFINMVYAGSILGVAYALLPLGLFGIGVAWLTGTCAAAAVSYAYYVDVPQASTRPTLMRRAYNFFDAHWEPVETWILYHYLYWRAPAANRLTLLIYPERPKTFHMIYKVAYAMGWRITTDPRSAADLVLYFEDATVRSQQDALLGRTEKIINHDCVDISKKHVEEVFSDVFGYSSFVDPTEHVGVCVKKSDSNALHDGQVVVCPCEAEEGYVYQKLINNQVSDSEVEDLRAIVVGDTVPILCVRRHPINDRFDVMTSERLIELHDGLSDDESRKLLEVCKRFGLDYGDVDMVRDRDDGRLYILDINNTPAAPGRGRVLETSEHDRFVRVLGEAFIEHFTTSNPARTLIRPHKPLWRRAQSFILSKWEPVETTLWAKYLYYRARALGRPRYTLLLYPERPKKFHIIYKIAHFMGWKIVYDPKVPADLAIYFEDITVRQQNGALPHQPRALNLACRDISKTRVEKVFSDVFGYSSFVDPRTHAGECVKKSDENAVHDGKIIQCPVEPEAGYIYQKLMHTEDGKGFAEDLRVCIMGSYIPILCIRKHPLSERFDITEQAVVGYPEDFFNPGEIGLMLEFCKKLGMEYGELDVLRDKTDGRMYIVDANNTPSAPRRGGQMTPLHHDEFIGAMGRSLAKQFLS